MCTVSWSLRPEGYDLCFNRDELDTRAPEQPPRLTRRDGACFLAPRDGDHGGTWLLVNESGLTICLLNDYGNARRLAMPAPLYSRGHLVRACAGAVDLKSVASLVRSQPLERTLPFHLVAIAPDRGPILLHWDGAALTRRVGPAVMPPLSSSSYATSEVIAARTAAFAATVTRRTRPDPAELFAFHRQHQRAAGAYSVLMRRPGAATRSIIHVSVANSRVGLDYQPVDWTPEGPTMPAPVRLVLARHHRGELAPMDRSPGSTRADAA